MPAATFDLLEKRGHETELSPGRIHHLKTRLENILAQVQPAIKQAHKRIISGRKLKNQDKILSLYDSDINILVRGKANAAVEFGNKLWLGETREGFIVDHLLERDQTSDSKHVLPAVQRLTTEPKLPIRKIWGDRGLDSKTNAKKLGELEIYNGLCPKNVIRLQERLHQEPQLRAGLKRRAGTEARISILTTNFMGDKPRAKGFEHRQMMIGWAVLVHNLWVLARLPRKPPDQQSQAA